MDPAITGPFTIWHIAIIMIVAALLARPPFGGR